jgi:energy-coupling factor transport system ATP-binding protein
MSDPIISLEHVTFTYPGGAEPALSEVTLEVQRGDFLAVIGSNGSGKSSLCKTFNGLIPHYYQGDLDGEITVAGRTSRAASVAELSRRVGYVYQDFENQLLRPRVVDDVGFAALNFGLADYRERARAALATLELDEVADSFIWELSGGQKHLVALAGVLALEPELIIVDEPVAQLDPVHAKTVYEKLKLLNEERGITIIVIEHLSEFIGQYARTVALVHDGTVRWSRPAAAALSDVAELERHQIEPPQVTMAAFRANGRSPARSAPSAGLPVTVADAVAHFTGSLPRTTVGSGAEQPGAAKAVTRGERGGSAPEADGESLAGRPPAVSLRGVTFGYKQLSGERSRVLAGLTLELAEGDRVALVGSNGAGKSTILRLIAGLVRPIEGTVRVFGQDTRSMGPEELAEEVSFIYQTPQEMFVEDSIRGDVAYYLRERGVEGADAFVERILGDFNLTDLADRDGRLLSGGQQRRASLAIGAAMQPSLMLLDEPTATLDVGSRRDIITTFADLKDWVHTAIIATHDMELVAAWANRVVVLLDGGVIADTTPAAVFGDAGLCARARIRPPQISALSRELAIAPVAIDVDEFLDRIAEREEESRAGIR